MKKVIFSDNGVLKDFSTALNNYSSGTKIFNFVTGEDYLYIGSKMAFNHLYFKLFEPNQLSASIEIDYLSSTGWKAVVDITDETNGFTESGFVTFTPDKNTMWQMKSTNFGGDIVPGLESLVIYDMYWLRISFNASLSSDTELSWIGNLFSSDDDLAVEFPDLVKQNVKTSFKPGKTDWEEQHVKAASILAQDLIDKGIIYETGQILNRHEYRDASIMKCAEIIFRALGDDFQDQRQQAREEYQHRLSKRLHKVDTNADAIEQIEERRREVGFLRR